MNFPALDPWGTSDPYVVLQLDGQVAKSKIKWATTDPEWNENFTFNIRIPPTNLLQVAAWDANLVTPHKRMGNSGLNVEALCDGNLHESVVELEGLGGGGKIYLEVRYKSYDEIDQEKQSWTIPFVSDFLMKSSLGSALKMALGSESINASQFVQSAFGRLKPSFSTYINEVPSPNSEKELSNGSKESLSAVAGPEPLLKEKKSAETSVDNMNAEGEKNSLEFDVVDDKKSVSLLDKTTDVSLPQDKYFWETFSQLINQTVVQKLGFTLPEIRLWEGFDLLNKMNLQSQKIAEEEYVESGLATPIPTPENNNNNDSQKDLSRDGTLSSILDIRKASWNILSQTETILGALMVLTTILPQKKDLTSVADENKRDPSMTERVDATGHSLEKTENSLLPLEASNLDTRKAEEMRKLFSSAESAMEAWAMLATSLGRTSFIKSEFEKICFLDNVSTDTQVALWRDSLRRRLVVAFRGTEQTRWKDLRTDLMLVPAGLNPERLGGDFKQEVQVHSGFLSAYDSVRNRIISLIKLSIGYFSEDGLETIPKWQVYVTGHSLGGALATLLALELASSRMAKCGVISVTMYNFGSPRVGNRRFAEVYNEKVKDSWRVVNHRDIIPTVPRLMGYCHVAQPVYLAARDWKETLINTELSEDEYQGDVIGESTPDDLVSEFMKGEKQLVEKILQTEINLLRSIRDGTALMQHMEDFYYIMLLQRVRSNFEREGKVMDNIVYPATEKP